MYIDVTATEVLVVMDEDVHDQQEIGMLTAMLDASNVPYSKRGSDRRTNFVFQTADVSQLRDVAEKMFWMVRHIHDRL